MLTVGVLGVVLLVLLAAAELGADVYARGQVHVAHGESDGTLLRLGGEGDDLGGEGRERQDESALHFVGRSVFPEISKVGEEMERNVLW